jgi:hypothetical protein
MAPVPPALQGWTKLATLQRGLELGTIAGLPEGVVAIHIPPDDAEESGSHSDCCPAFSCCGTVQGHGKELVARLTVYGKAQRHNAKESRELESARLDLKGAEGVVQTWTDLSAAFQATQHRQCALQAIAGEGLPGVGVERVGPTVWRFVLDEQAARQIALRKHSLVNPTAIAISSEEAIVEVYVHFYPADDNAARFFAVDWVVCRLDESGHAAKTPELALLLQEAMKEYRLAQPIDFPMVRERLWGLGYYRLLYRLRQQEDFTYA